MKTTTLVKLQNDLTKFGLNPTEWCLRKLGQRQYRIENRGDQHLYLLGEVHLSGLLPQWKQIRWMDL